MISPSRFYIYIYILIYIYIYIYIYIHTYTHMLCCKHNMCMCTSGVTQPFSKLRSTFLCWFRSWLISYMRGEIPKNKRGSRRKVDSKDLSPVILSVEVGMRPRALCSTCRFPPAASRHTLTWHDIPKWFRTLVGRESYPGISIIS